METRVVDLQKVANLAYSVTLMLRKTNFETLRAAVEAALKAELEYSADYGVNSVDELINVLEARHIYLQSYWD